MALVVDNTTVAKFTVLNTVGLSVDQHSLATWALHTSNRLALGLGLSVLVLSAFDLVEFSNLSKLMRQSIARVAICKAVLAVVSQETT